MDSFDRQITQLAALWDRHRPVAPEEHVIPHVELNPAQLGQRLDEIKSRLRSSGLRLTGDHVALSVVSPTRPVGHNGRLHQTQVDACRLKTANRSVIAGVRPPHLKPSPPKSNCATPTLRTEITAERTPPWTLTLTTM